VAFQTAARRRVFVTLAAVSFLLSISCAKKVSLPAQQASTYITAQGGGGGGDKPRSVRKLDVSPSAEQADIVTGSRKIVRNGSLELLVNDVDQAVGKIRAIVDGMGGFVEKSTQTNTVGHAAGITVRVPTGRLDQAMSEVKNLAINVERENVEARDVTRDYIDLDARLRNAQAEEAQYLQILKRAATVKDTLDVSEKLSDVRGRIEQLTGEMKYLATQIDMSSLEISIRAEAEARVLGIHWRPLRQAKVALSEMLSDLTDWADYVIAFFINLPLITVWLVSVVALVAIALRVLRFFWLKLGPKTTWRLPWVRSRSSGRPTPD